MRLIDADALKDFINRQLAMTASTAVVMNAKDFFENIVDNAPTIEQKKGRWAPFDRTWGRSVWACDACGETVDVPTLNGKPIFDYCPWCGAKMERSEDD